MRLQLYIYERIWSESNCKIVVRYLERKFLDKNLHN